MAMSPTKWVEKYVFKTLWNIEYAPKTIDLVDDHAHKKCEEFFIPPCQTPKKRNVNSSNCDKTLNIWKIWVDVKWMFSSFWWKTLVVNYNYNQHHVTPKTKQMVNQCKQTQTHPTWRVPKSQVRPKVGLGLKQWNCADLRAHSQLSALKGIEGCAEASGWN